MKTALWIVVALAAVVLMTKGCYRLGPDVIRPMMEDSDGR